MSLAKDTLGQVRSCGSYRPGHHVHWIQAFQSARNPGLVETAEVVAIVGGVISVSVGGGVRRYRNHDVERFADAAHLFGPLVLIQEGWSSLKIDQPGGRYVFSIVADEGEELACPSREELVRYGAGGVTTRAGVEDSPDGFAERLLTALLGTDRAAALK